MALDFEWKIDTGEIYCAGFMDDSGKGTVWHSANFNNNERVLLQLIKAKIMSYPISVGFWSRGKGSDLDKFHERCIANNITPITKITNFGPEIEGRIHIDMHSVLDKLVVKNYIYKKMYKDMGLNALSLALLGHSKLAAHPSDTMTVDEVKKYCLWDANLAMMLSKLGTVDKITEMPAQDGVLMQLWEAVAKKINRPLANVCHYGMGFIWKSMMIDDGVPETDPQYHPKPTDGKRAGPFIMEPITGDYRNVAVLDVASLYPSIVVNHNISPEVMNCECCQDPENIDELPKYSVTSATNKMALWTCQKRQGIVSEKFKSILAERLECKKKGEKVFADGLKIILNAWTGLSNNAYFVYADTRCYDAIIAWERVYIQRIIDIAREYNTAPIYSDTDSIFFVVRDNVDIDKIIEEVKKRHGLTIEHEKTYRKFLITGKKHYIGVKDDDKVTIAAMEGEKNDRPIWINEVFEQFVYDYANDLDPSTLLQANWEEFDAGRVPIEKLAFNTMMHKDGKDYAKGHMLAKLAPDAKAGQIVRYYKTRHGADLQATWQELEPKDYKSLYKATFKGILSTMGIDIDSIINKSSGVQQTL